MHAMYRSLKDPETTRTHLRLLILLHYVTKRQTPPAPLTWCIQTVLLVFRVLLASCILT